MRGSTWFKQWHSRDAVRLRPPAPEGRFDLSLFDQRVVWVAEDGTVFRVDDLTEAQRVQLAGWLVRHARHFYAQRLAWELVSSVGRPYPALAYASAEEWLISTRLVQALAGSDMGTAPWARFGSTWSGP